MGRQKRSAGFHCVRMLIRRFLVLVVVRHGLRRGEVFHGDAADAVAVHLGYRDSGGLRSRCFRPTVGMWPSCARRKPARVSTPASRGKTQWSWLPRSRRVVCRRGHGSGGGEQRRAADVELVFELADDLLQDVFGGDETDGGAELVDDDGDVAAALLKLLEELNRQAWSRERR